MLSGSQKAGRNEHADRQIATHIASALPERYPCRELLAYSQDQVVGRRNVPRANHPRQTLRMLVTGWAGQTAVGLACPPAGHDEFAPSAPFRTMGAIWSGRFLGNAGRLPVPSRAARDRAMGGGGPLVSEYRLHPVCYLVSRSIVPDNENFGIQKGGFLRFS